VTAAPAESDKMPLLRLTDSNGLFDRLQTQWADECASFGEAFADYAVERLEHARKIVSEDPQDIRYGIFGLERSGRFDVIMHVNRAALPGSPGWTLRFVWLLLSPRFDFLDTPETEIASIASDIIFDALNLAGGDWPAENVKIHIGNFADRMMFSGIAAALAHVPTFRTAAVRGGWMELALVNPT
jgi:hypothetical protein